VPMSSPLTYASIGIDTSKAESPPNNDSLLSTGQHQNSAQSSASVRNEVQYSKSLAVPMSSPLTYASIGIDTSKAESPPNNDSLLSTGQHQNSAQSSASVRNEVQHLNNNYIDSSNVEIVTFAGKLSLMDTMLSQNSNTSELVTPTYHISDNKTSLNEIMPQSAYRFESDNAAKETNNSNFANVLPSKITVSLPLPSSTSADKGHFAENILTLNDFSVTENLYVTLEDHLSANMSSSLASMKKTNRKSSFIGVINNHNKDTELRKNVHENSIDAIGFEKVASQTTTACVINADDALARSSEENAYTSSKVKDSNQNIMDEIWRGNERSLYSKKVKKSNKGYLEYLQKTFVNLDIDYDSGAKNGNMVDDMSESIGTCELQNVQLSDDHSSMTENDSINLNTTVSTDIVTDYTDLGTIESSRIERGFGFVHALFHELPSENNVQEFVYADETSQVETVVPLENHKSDWEQIGNKWVKKKPMTDEQIEIAAKLFEEATSRK
jgi:hypothetical protein